MSNWPAAYFALQVSFLILVGFPFALSGCQVLLSQIHSLQNSAGLETAITWKERDLARPQLDVQVRNVGDVSIAAVAVNCEFQDAMGATIFRSRVYLPQPLHAGETQHLYTSSFDALPRFERAKCEAEGV